MAVTLQFLGSGDAFGSGGRLQTCLLIQGAGDSVLVDCGCSSLIAMKRNEVDPSATGYIVLSHLHGDHFGGVPFLILDSQFSRRSKPLVMAGPPGVQERVEAAMEVLFPLSTRAQREISVDYVELADRVRTEVGPAGVTALLVEHACGAPPFALRIEYGGKLVAYSGDTEWCENLIAAADGVELFVAEAYHIEKNVKYHLNYRAVCKNRARFRCRRMILTHMSEDVLSRIAGLEIEAAHDGLAVEV